VYDIIVYDTMAWDFNRKEKGKGALL